MTCMLMYDDKTSLRQYCIKNNYSYNIINRYIMEQGLSVQEAIEKHKKCKGRHDTKAIFFYKGMTLMQYCKKVNLPYPTIRGLVINKNYTIESAIEHILEFRKRKNERKKKKV